MSNLVNWEVKLNFSILAFTQKQAGEKALEVIKDIKGIMSFEIPSEPLVEAGLLTNEVLTEWVSRLNSVEE